MDRLLRTLPDEPSVTLPRAVVLGGILVLTVVLLGTITVAPRLLGSALTFGLAAAWCRWLERHPDAMPEAPSAPADETTASR